MNVKWRVCKETIKKYTKTFEGLIRKLIMYYEQMFVWEKVQKDSQLSTV